MRHVHDIDNRSSPNLKIGRLSGPAVGEMVTFTNHQPVSRVTESTVCDDVLKPTIIVHPHTK